MMLMLFCNQIFSISTDFQYLYTKKNFYSVISIKFKIQVSFIFCCLCLPISKSQSKKQIHVSPSAVLVEQWKTLAATWWPVPVLNVLLALWDFFTFSFYFPAGGVENRTLLSDSETQSSPPSYFFLFCFFSCRLFHSTSAAT